MNSASDRVTDALVCLTSCMVQVPLLLVATFVNSEDDGAHENATITTISWAVVSSILVHRDIFIQHDHVPHTPIMILDERLLCCVISKLEHEFLRLVVV